MRLATLVLFLALPLAAPAQPLEDAEAGRVDVRVQEARYDIEGDTAAELAAAMRASGPETRGTRFFGRTDWEVQVSYRPAEHATGCVIAAPTVRADITVHLPRWTDAHAAPPKLRKSWHRFIRALERHERQHQRLAEEAAYAVRRRLHTVRAAQCDELDAAARWAVRDVLSEHEERQLAYDAETGHGLTQGAAWPHDDGAYATAR